MQELLLQSALLITVGLAAVLDVRTRRIPNALTVSGLAVALALHSVAGPAAVGQSLLGAALAFGILMPLFVVGAVGGGDAKLLIAVGAFLGTSSLLAALGYTALFGGLMALVVVIRRGVVVPAVLNAGGILKFGLSAGRTGRLPSGLAPDAVRIPYGVAIAFGSLLASVL